MQAESYDRLDRVEDAIKCFLRAEGNQDREGIALAKLAKLYGKLGDKDMGAKYYEKVLARHDEDGTGDRQTVTESLVFLAEYCKNKQEFERSETYCNRLLDQGGAAKEQAKALLMEVRQLHLFFKSSGSAASSSSPSPSLGFGSFSSPSSPAARSRRGLQARRYTRRTGTPSQST